MIIAVILKEIEKNNKKYYLVMSVSSLEEINLIKKKDILKDLSIFPIVGYADVNDINELIAKKLVREKPVDKEREEKRLKFLSILKTKNNDNNDDIYKYYCYQEDEYFHVSALKSFQSAIRLLKNPRFITIQKLDYDTNFNHIKLYTKS